MERGAIGDNEEEVGGTSIFDRAKPKSIVIAKDRNYVIHVRTDG
jgi:hypothetical protein